MNDKRNGRVLLRVIILEVLVLGGGFALIIFAGFAARRSSSAIEDDTETEMTIAYEAITEPVMAETVVPAPDIDEQLLTVNPWSRPGKSIISLDKIVVHYLGNPQTTAQQNHDYFESLKNQEDDDPDGVSMSANYVIGLEGEIIHCVPDDEVAYASNQMNSYSLSIENCHPDETGKFTDETYESLVKLVAYLTDQHGLGRDDIIRHYDVTEKDCPKYFVENPEEWERFKDDVMAYREECEAAAQAEYEAQRDATVADDELAQFLQDNAAENDG